MKKWLYAGAFAVIFAGCVIWAATRRPMARTVTIGAVLRAHNSVSLLGEDDFVTFDILIDTKKSFAGENCNITEAYLANDDGEYLKLKVESVEFSGDSLPLGDNTYYLYYFTFLIDFHPTTEYFFEIADAELTINYRCGASVRLPVGSFSYNKVASFIDDCLSVRKLKGLVNVLDGRKTLAAVDIGIKNDTESDIFITAISPLVPDVAFSFSERVASDALEYRPDCEIDLILGYAYDYFNGVAAAFNYRLPAGERACFLLPLKYRRLLPVNKFGIAVDYTIAGESRRLVCDDFTFFKTREISLKALQNIEFRTYENY